MENDSGPGLPEVQLPAAHDPSRSSGTLGSSQIPGSINVNVKADNLNIHPSSISALERIAERSPEIASQLIKSADGAVQSDAKKYTVGAIAAAVVALAIIIGSAAVLIAVGVTAGLLFFMACVAASAIVTAIFTGKPQDLSWTVRLLGGSKAVGDEPPTGET